MKQLDMKSLLKKGQPQQSINQLRGQETYHLTACLLNRLVERRKIRTESTSTSKTCSVKELYTRLTVDVEFYLIVKV